MLKIRCTQCGAKMNAPDSFAGKRVKCKGCETVIQIPMTTGAGQEQTAPRTVTDESPIKSATANPPVETIEPIALAPEPLPAKSESPARSTAPAPTQADEIPVAPEPDTASSKPATPPAMTASTHDIEPIALNDSNDGSDTNDLEALSEAVAALPTSAVAAVPMTAEPVPNLPAESPSRATDEPGNCPNCGSRLLPNARVCATCDHRLADDATGGRSKSGSGSPVAVGGLVGGLVGGCIGAVIGGVIWGGVAYVTEYELGWIAWLVGVLAGVGTMAAGGEPGLRAAGIATSMAVLGILIGKVLLVQWCWPAWAAWAAWAEQYANNEEEMIWVVEIYMYENRKFTPEIQKVYDSENWTEELATKADNEVKNYYNNMSEDDRKKLAGEFILDVTTDMSLTDQILSTLGIFDIIWFLLAIGTAAKIGIGGASEQ